LGIQHRLIAWHPEKFKGDGAQGIFCTESNWINTTKGTNMRSILARLVIRIAEYVDRSLYTVPDIDQPVR
jgi:hypothetical protein